MVKFIKKVTRISMQSPLINKEIKLSSGQSKEYQLFSLCVCLSRPIMTCVNVDMFTLLTLDSRSLLRISLFDLCFTVE
jgi:hypothetical protein